MGRLNHSAGIAVVDIIIVAILIWLMKFAVFIDRDGTINQEVGYVDRFDRFSILPKVPDAIRRLNEGTIPAIMVTNQSGIGRGYFSKEFLAELHKGMTGELRKHNATLDGIYICPHAPDDRCVCRKPRPGMLLKAAREKGISLHNSYVIGDKIIDVQLAHSVGAKGILVMTGYGSEEIKSLPKDSPDNSPERLPENLEDKPDYVASNLYEAVDWVIKEVRSKKQEVRGQNRRILIVKPSSLGDIVHSLPVLRELRKLFPDAHIGWLVKEVWKDILTENPLLDEIIVLNKGPAGFFAAIRDVRNSRFDTIIDLQGLFRSGAISLFSGAYAKLGFENARESAHLFYNKKIKLPDKPLHAVNRYLLAIDAIAGDEIRKQYQGNAPDFPLYINTDDAEWAIEFLKKNGLGEISPLIAINPSARWLKKRWPVQLFAELINRLIKELKAGIILLGSRDDIPLAGEISSLVHGKLTVAAGTTSIKTLTALLDRVDVLITNDSGPMHIAAALGKPVTALFGPTDPGLTGPYGKNHTVIKKDMECSPCFRKPCKYKRPICMESITVEEVMETVKTKLAIKD